MKKLVQGIVDFRNNLTEESRAHFAKLALGQKPDALFITCSDSRVAANVFASRNPGDLFVLRNIGNLIPPANSKFEDSSASAAIEFSILQLNISDIIVCGHSECGAMQSLCKGLCNTSSPYLNKWLKHGMESLNKLRSGLVIDPLLSEHNQLSQINVLQQIEHIQSYPFVINRKKQNKLRIHGMWFDIAQADVYYYEDGIKKFVLLDEEEGRLLLSRLT